MLAFVLASGKQEISGTERPAPGKAAVSKQVLLKLDEEWQTLTLPVGAMEYEEAQIEQVHQAAEAYLEEIIAGDQAHEHQYRVHPSFEFDLTQSEYTLGNKEREETSSYVGNFNSHQGSLKIHGVRHHYIAEIRDGNERKYQRYVHVKMLMPDNDVSQRQKN